MKHLLIPSLSDLIQPGIFGIIHNRNIYIGYSNNLLQSVSRQLTSIQERVHTHINADIKDVQLVIIETTTSNLKLRQTYWCDYYKAQGFFREVSTFIIIIFFCINILFRNVCYTLSF